MGEPFSSPSDGDREVTIANVRHAARLGFAIRGEAVGEVLAALDAARAEIERLRTHYTTLDAAATALDCAPCEVATVAARLRERLTRAEQRTAADERADVVAWLRRAGYEAADVIEQGAHVGAAKGGER